MYHIITNIERLESMEFAVVLLYDDSGFLADNCVPVYEGADKVADFIIELLLMHGKTAATVWTSDKELYAVFLQVPGLGAELKHRDDTSDTTRAIVRDLEILTEFHSIEPAAPLKPMPKWRKWLYLLLKKLTNKVGGDFYHD